MVGCILVEVGGISFLGEDFSGVDWVILKPRGFERSGVLFRGVVDLTIWTGGAFLTLCAGISFYSERFVVCFIWCWGGWFFVDLLY